MAYGGWTDAMVNSIANALTGWANTPMAPPTAPPHGYPTPNNQLAFHQMQQQMQMDQDFIDKMMFDPLNFQEIDEPMTTVTPDDPHAVNDPVTPATTPTFSPTFAEMAQSNPDTSVATGVPGYGYGVLGSTASSPTAQQAALADAVGYANSQATDTGYGYGLSLGADASSTGNPGGLATGGGVASTGENDGGSVGFGSVGPDGGTASGNVGGMATGGGVASTGENGNDGAGQGQGASSGTGGGVSEGGGNEGAAAAGVGDW
jgi:hypothetical protein